MSNLSLLLIVSCINLVIGVEYIPVLLWGTGYTKGLSKSPALKKVSSDSFRDQITNLASNSDLVLLFAEENLSVEDFTWKNDVGESSYVEMSKLTGGDITSEFLPSVEDPVETLLRDASWDKVTSASKLATHLTSKKASKYILVQLDDASDTEDRPDMLKRHDSKIAEAVNAAKDSHGRILVIYTGYHSSWVPYEVKLRHVRSLLAVEAAENGTFVNAENKTFLYTSEPITYMKGTQEVKLETLKRATVSQVENERSLNMTLEYEASGKTYTLVFAFPQAPVGYWNLKDISITESGTSETTVSAKDINAPYRFSYHCSQDIVFSNKDNVSLIFKNLQVEPLPPSTLGEETFSESYDCVWFFTIPILMGLLTTILLLTILSIGLCFITDIKTMDRFDDPKGKTITITATD